MLLLVGEDLLMDTLFLQALLTGWPLMTQALWHTRGNGENGWDFLNGFNFLTLHWCGWGSETSWDLQREKGSCPTLPSPAGTLPSLSSLPWSDLPLTVKLCKHTFTSSSMAGKDQSCRRDLAECQDISKGKEGVNRLCLACTNPSGPILPLGDLGKKEWVWSFCLLIHWIFSLLIYTTPSLDQNFQQLLTNILFQGLFYHTFGAKYFICCYLCDFSVSLFHI